MLHVAGFYHWFLYGEGYQITSGPIVVVSVITFAVTWCRHHNCHQRGCLRIGHRHPGHGRPVCRRHYHRPFDPAG